MALTHAERGRRGGLKAQANLTPAERAASARKARIQLAVNELVRAWPELTEDQQQRLRSLLRPVPETGDAA